MTQRYIDLAFDDTSPRSFGGFDNENEATVIRLKVLNPDAKYYIEIEQACGKHDKYCSDVLPIADEYAVFEVPRDFTHETLYVQGVMKVNGMCRKTARVRVGFSHSINALDELPESQPSWADSVDERIDGLEMGMKDAVLYTPQTLTDEQQKQARTNIGALDENIETTPVDIDVTLFGRGENIVYVKDGWLKPCPTDADNELILQYGRVFNAIGLQRAEPNSEDILLRAKSAYSLYQKGLASESITVTNDPLNATCVYVTWNIVTRSNKHYIYYAQVSTSYNYNCTYCVEDDALTNESYKSPVYRTASGVGKQDSVSQFRMRTNPTEDMNIATKQYVDTAKTEAQQLGLTTATPGQIIKVKAVQDGKPTEWEAVDMPGGGVQSDWNQNDSTQPDYVKNRPFYTGDPVESVLLEEQIVTFYNDGDDAEPYYMSDEKFSFDISAGDIVKVMWDGTEYSCIAVELNYSVKFGNLSIDYDDKENTGEPFIFDGRYFCTKTSTDESHRIKLSKVSGEVNQIDKKYLPDDAPYLSKKNPTGFGSFSLNRAYNTGIGDYSFAEGSYTTASGYSSHAEGNYTIASGSESHVQGHFNVADNKNKYAHIVGNGISDTKRSNAHTLDWSGNAWFAGDVYVRSTSGTDKDEGSKKLATEEYVDTAKTEAQQLGLTSATPGQIIKVKTVQDGKPTEWEAVDMPGGGGTAYTIGHGLKLDAETNTLSVDTADKMEQDNTLPITSAAVYVEVGNINALLKTI